MRNQCLSVRLRRAVAALAGCALCLAAPHSAEGDGLGPNSLAEAIAIAREGNPEIRAAQASYRSMRERPSQLGTLPDPMLSVRYHNEKFSELTFDESDFSFVEIAAEQEVPFPGKLSLRREIAEREADRERAMRDMTVLMVLSGVATSWAELEVADRSEAILLESARALALIRDQTAARYSVGDATQQDVLRAGLEIGAIEE